MITIETSLAEQLSLITSQMNEVLSNSTLDQTTAKITKLQRSKKIQRALKDVRNGTLIPVGFRSELRWTELESGVNTCVFDDPFRFRVYDAEDSAWDQTSIFHPDSPLMASTFDPYAELRRAIKQDWFVALVGHLQIHIRLVEDDDDEMPFYGRACQVSNTIEIKASMTPAFTFHVLVHELAHLLVKRPYAAHGRLFNHTAAWIWSHLDERFRTNQAEVLISYFELNKIPYLPREFDVPASPPNTLVAAFKANPYLDVEDLRQQGGCFWIYDRERTDSPDIIHLCKVLQAHNIKAKIGHRKKGWRKGQCGIFLPRRFSDRVLRHELAEEIRKY